jgi:hypothetical protein
MPHAMVTGDRACSAPARMVKADSRRLRSLLCRRRSLKALSTRIMHVTVEPTDAPIVSARAASATGAIIFGTVVPPVIAVPQASSPVGELASN